MAKCGMIGQGKRMNVMCMAASVPADRVPDMGKRKLMNLLLLGAIALPSTGMLYPYTYFFVPPGSVSLSFSRSIDRSVEFDQFDWNILAPMIKEGDTPYSVFC